MKQIELHIGGKIYKGWEQVRIVRSMEALSGEFSLSLTKSPFRIKGSQSCEITYGNAKILSGYIYYINPSYDSKANSLTISGRDKTADLIDCSAPLGQWAGQTILFIISELSSKLGITVINQSKNEQINKPIENFAVNPGETIFEVIDRLARLKGCIAICDNGRLVMTNASKSSIPAKLEYGKNIKSANGQFSMEGRYSQITVCGQSPSTDTWGAGSASAASYTISDAGVTRYRPLIIIAEDNATAEICKNRAQWEKTVRYGRSQEIVYTVSGWTYDGKNLWPINRLVFVKDTNIDVNKNMLITTVEYTLDDQGERTVITVKPAEALSAEPITDNTQSTGWF